MYEVINICGRGSINPRSFAVVRRSKGQGQIIWAMPQDNTFVRFTSDRLLAHAQCRALNSGNLTADADGFIIR